jgi:hypothetical protein
MSFTNTVAGQLRIAIADLEQLTHSRTKESFAKVRASILKKLTQSADMLEGQFEIVPDEPAAKPAPKKRAPRTRRDGNVIAIDFKTRARADAESVFKK